MKLVIGVVAFGAGVFAGIQITKWYAQQRITTGGDKVISKVFGSGYAGSLVTGLFNGAIDQAVN